VPSPARAPSIAVLADDLIWSDRLVRALRKAGADPRPVRDPDQLGRLAVAEPDPIVGVVVDLTARRYDGVAAVEAAARAGIRVLAVGQHDDLELRRRARAAGADRVLVYRKVFADGPAVLAAWLAETRR